MAATVTPLDVGDRVYSDYSGRITHHRITAVHLHARGCQSGVLYEVSPALSANGPAALIDHAWFTLITKGTK